MFLVFAVLVGLIPVIPAVVYLLQNGKASPVQAVSRIVNGFTGFNFLVGMFAAGLAMVWLASPTSVLAAGAAQEGGVVDQYATLAAALSCSSRDWGTRRLAGGPWPRRPSARRFASMSRSARRSAKSRCPTADMPSPRTTSSPGRTMTMPCLRSSAKPTT